MCGRCRSVFNAFESLKRIEDTEGAHGPSSPADSVETAVNSPEPSEFPPLNVSNLHDMAPETPPEFTATDSVEEASAIAETSGTVMATDVDGVVAVAPPSTGRIHEAPSFLLADRAPENGEDNKTAEHKGVVDNPLLRTSYRPDPQPRRAMWIVGIVLLLMVATAQAIYFFRATAMEIYPQTEL